jgi:hypothetical protein
MLMHSTLRNADDLFHCWQVCYTWKEHPYRNAAVNKAVIRRISLQRGNKHLDRNIRVVVHLN